MEFAEAKQLLEAERDRLMEARRQLAGDSRSVADPGDGGAVDTSGAANAIEERDETAALSAGIEADISEVDQALARVEKGTYGKCEACGTAIPDERLTAFPTARYCVTDQRAVEQRRLR